MVPVLTRLEVTGANVQLVLSQKMIWKLAKVSNPICLTYLNENCQGSEMT